MTTGIIIQAHIPSTRLYGKILKKIGNETILERVINSCLKTNVDWVIVATTSNELNWQIEDIIDKQKYFNNRFFDKPILSLYKYSGDEEDVLGRYYSCAKEYSLNTIIRITSDCPFISSEIINLIVKTFFYTKSDVMDFLDIDGMEVQCVNIESLEKAHKEAKSKHDREHVLPYMYDHPELFNIKHLKNGKLSVDTEEDLDKIRKIAAY